MDLEDESSISEINILPDGRVCLFGASQQILELLDAIPLGDPALRSRIDCLCPSGVPQTVVPSETCSAQNDETVEESSGTMRP